MWKQENFKIQETKTDRTKGETEKQKIIVGDFNTAILARQNYQRENEQEDRRTKKEDLMNIEQNTYSCQAVMEHSP